MPNKIVVVGSSNVDLIIKGDKIPARGETVLGGTFYKAAGGKGANQAVAASRAAGKVSFISCVGNEYGDESIEGFRRDGINVDHVKKDPDIATGIALILVDKNGENSISVASGAGVKTILNPAPARPLSDELLNSVSILTPNETETEILTGMSAKNETDAIKAASMIHKKGVEVVIITIGSKGALLASRDETKIIGGHKVEAIDTTAAGDVFNGALAVAIAENKSLDEAIRFANAAAAVSVTRMGAQPSAPTREEIDKMLY